MTFSTTSINREIKDLWDTHQPDTRAPLFYPDLEKNALLFIGMNPSFSSKGFKQNLKDTEFRNWSQEDIEEFYKWNNITESRIKKFIEFEALSRTNHSYFRRFREISDQVGIKWTHIDLVLIRNTAQKEVETLFGQNDKGLDAQIQICIQLLQLLDPKIVVVENAFVRKVLMKKLNFQWNESIGTYLLKNSIPVFFTSMLTGQRALDLGSLERLVWHIKYVQGITTS